MQIESVQRRFTKRLPGLFNVSCKQRLVLVSLETLGPRRLHQDLLYTNKIIFRRVDIEVDTMFDIRPYAATRGHQWKLSPAFNRVDVRKHFFANRVIAPWNSLNLFEDNVKSVATFKMLLLESYHVIAY